MKETRIRRGLEGGHAEIQKLTHEGSEGGEADALRNEQRPELRPAGWAVVSHIDDEADKQVCPVDQTATTRLQCLPPFHWREGTLRHVCGSDGSTQLAVRGRPAFADGWLDEAVIGFGERVTYPAADQPGAFIVQFFATRAEAMDCLSTEERLDQALSFLASGR